VDHRPQELGRQAARAQAPAPVGQAALVAALQLMTPAAPAAKRRAVQRAGAADLAAAAAQVDQAEVGAQVVVVVAQTNRRL
jgi:hypothetical protein